MKSLMKIIGLLLGLCFVVLEACPAQAGTWSATQTATGTKRLGNIAFPWGTGTNSSTGGAPTSTSGTYTYTCKWIPSSVSELNPRAVRIPVAGSIDVQSSDASASVGGSIIGNKKSTQPLAVERNSGSIRYYARTWNVSGSVLYTIPNGGKPSNGVVLNFTINIPTSASFLGSYSYGGTASVSAGPAVLDTRTVSLSRGGAPLKEDNPDLRKDRDDWIDATATEHVHTLASFYERIALDPIVSMGNREVRDEVRDVVQTIGAARIGGWSGASNLTFKWNAPGITDSITSHSQSMPQSNAINNPDGIFRNILGGDSPNYPTQNTITLPGWINTPSDKSGQVFNVTYELTDRADDAKSDAKCELNLHDEWEYPIADERQHPLGDNSAAGKGVTYEEQYYVPAGASSETAGNEAKWEITKNSKFTVTLTGKFEAGFKIGDWGNAGGSIETSKEIIANPK